jgi:hypothetical protein
MWWLPLLMVLFAGLIIVVDSNWFAMRFRRWRMGYR